MLLAAFPRLGAAEAGAPRRLNREMRRAIQAGDFDRCYVQERFIEQYYFADGERKPAKGRRA